MGAGHNRLLLYTHDGPRVGARRRDLGPDAVARRAGLCVAGRDGAARVLGPGRHRALSMLHQLAKRVARMSGRASSSAPGRTGWPPRSGSPRPGAPVTVLEAADPPGGAVRTEELTLPGFRHDTFSSVHPAAAASPVFARMPLADHGLRWIHPDGVLRAPAARWRARSRCTARSTRTAASLDAVEPGDGARWARSSEPLLDAFDALRATMLAGFPPVAGAAQPARGAGPVRRGAFGAARPGSAAAASAAAVRRRGLARVAVRLGRPRRRAARPAPAARSRSST